MDQQMDAVVFSALGQYEITTRPTPQIENPQDVLVKILAASICGTDVHILHNPPGVIANPGIILGHECVAEIVVTGPAVKAFRAGDRVVADNNLPCGTCPACLGGNANLCQNMSSMGVHIDGVFAQYAVFPDTALVKISPDVPLEKAIFAEPLNCVMGAMKKLKVMPGDTVLVLGGGPIGQYFTGLMKASGAGKVLVSEISDFRANFALKQGATRVIRPDREDLLAVVLEETKGVGADIVIDAVGVLLKDALATVKNGGSILLFGMNANARQEISQNTITARGLTIYGNFIGLNTLYNTVNTLENAVVDFENLVTHQLALKDFATGLEAMQKGQAMEVVLYLFPELKGK
jgi:threonine dehydrogenase-like Zn-dependent dehydrogenase